MVVPVAGLGAVVVEVDDQAAAAARGGAQGIGVGDDVGFDVSRAADEDLDFIGVVLAVDPIGVAGGAPDTGSRIEMHGQDGRLAAGGRVIDMQPGRLGGGSPDSETHPVFTAAGMESSQTAVVGVEIVEHAGNLQGCGVEQGASGVEARDY